MRTLHGDYALVDGDRARFRRHCFKWAVMFVVTIAFNYYLTRELTVTRDIWSTIAWFVVNGFIGGAGMTAFLQPLRVKNAYDEGAIDMQLKAARVGVYIEMDGE